MGSTTESTRVLKNNSQFVPPCFVEDAIILSPIKKIVDEQTVHLLKLLFKRRKKLINGSYYLQTHRTGG